MSNSGSSKSRRNPAESTRRADSGSQSSSSSDSISESSISEQIKKITLKIEVYRLLVNLVLLSFFYSQEHFRDTSKTNSTSTSQKRKLNNYFVIRFTAFASLYRSNCTFPLFTLPPPQYIPPTSNTYQSFLMTRQRSWFFCRIHFTFSYFADNFK